MTTLWIALGSVYLVLGLVITAVALRAAKKAVGPANRHLVVVSPGRALFSILAWPLFLFLAVMEP